MSNVFNVQPVLDYCTALGFKVVGGRRNEEGKKVAIVTDVIQNSIADKDIKLLVGEYRFDIFQQNFMSTFVFYLVAPNTMLNSHLRVTRNIIDFLMTGPFKQ